MVKESFWPTMATSLGLSARAYTDGRKSAATRAASTIREAMPVLDDAARLSDLRRRSGAPSPQGHADRDQRERDRHDDPDREAGEGQRAAASSSRCAEHA